ncbi:hypothetical protein CDAR_424171 [Caerostris darwini]|uniref:Uncharacterized protein n=1 Tax=Caerostris darwini TaxID=1538125 RepID=A0AAV4T212_9ARAC|nr:hypothetical protein CDAR_424171 [Caerostris darwini]
MSSVNLTTSEEAALLDKDMLEARNINVCKYLSGQHWTSEILDVVILGFVWTWMSDGKNFPEFLNSHISLGCPEFSRRYPKFHYLKFNEGSLEVSQCFPQFLRGILHQRMFNGAWFPGIFVKDKERE